VVVARPVPELAEGTLIDGRYRLVGRLGSGGMADVYCASDEQLGRRVALKLLHPRFAEDQEFVERFRREASHAAGLQHPHVVSVYDRGEWEGTYYIAMEYLEGRSLKELLEEEGPLAPVRAIDIVVQILRAARFAHQRGVIHRDLKPHNVIIEEEDRVKVTDFGIARAGASDVTLTGSIMGTAQYLSPEQAQGHAVSDASDLYSIGIVIYELLTGRVPFEGPSAVTIALKQVSEAPIAPSAYNPAVTPELDWVVLHALEKDPAQRFASADQFIDALEHARAGLLAPAGSSTAEWAALAAAAPPPPSAPVNGAPADEAYLPPPVPYAQPARRTGRRWPWVLLLVALLVGLAVAGVLLLPTDQRRVPSVVNDRADRAAVILRRQGFKVAQRSATSATVARNYVISQSPAARTMADRGSTVALVVSGGPAAVLVPDVAGEARAVASAQLRAAGFRVTERHQSSDTVGSDHVISTSPPGATNAPQGSRVIVTISTGRGEIAVPPLVGKRVADARATLQAAGLGVDTVDQASDTEPPGTVIAQTPDPGVRAARGTSVTLTVAKKPDLVAVSAVVGLGQDAADAELAREGLKVNHKMRSISDPTRDGTVVAQNPAAGTKARRGSTVTLTIGTFGGGSGGGGAGGGSGGGTGGSGSGTPGSGGSSTPGSGGSTKPGAGTGSGKTGSAGAGAPSASAPAPRGWAASGAGAGAGAGDGLRA